MGAETRNRDELINIIKWPKWGMILCGTWSKPLSENTMVKAMYKVYSKLTVILFTWYYLSLIVELLRLIIQKYDTATVMSSFGVVITVSKIAGIMTIYYKNNVLDIFPEVTKMEEDIWKENNPEIIKFFMRYVKWATAFSRIIWITTILTVGSVNVVGVIGNRQLNAYNNANNLSIESHYLYRLYFPANKLDHQVIMAFMSIILSAIAAFQNVICNMIVVVLCISSASHLKILQHRLRNYIPDDFTDDQMDTAILTLRGFISKQKQIIDYTTRLNQSCKSIIMMEFLLTSVDIAMATLNMLKLNLEDLGWVIPYIPMLISQIFSIAWSSNEVLVQSQGVADAAYESRWYYLNREGKYLTQILIHRSSQRPLIMTIGPFGPMTMETFLMIMKAAYSYVSVMRRSSS